jgi:hypothetical protein
MVTIDRLDSEVEVGSRGPGAGERSEGATEPADEKARLRQLIRELLREELERFLRTEATR